jgi:hypothetical protein
MRCEECGHEYLLAFSCKCRHFCPSCHQKRVAEYGEWLLTNVLNDAIIENMLSWHHSGFNVYIGDRIEPDDNLKVTRKTGLGNLARYIIRACFSQERMVYVPAKKSDDGVAKVIYTSKDRKTRKVFKFLTFRL